MRVWALCVAVLPFGCSSAPPRPVAANVGDERRAIAGVLDDWHRAAAEADEARYFAHFTDDGVFLGTDATERWSTAEFRAFAHPHFARGRAWAFRATRRDIVVDPGGRLAWFDEDLATDTVGPSRGSGVLRRDAAGPWRIAQYNLAITVPNERFASVRAMLEDRARDCALEELPAVDLELGVWATPSCRSHPSRTLTVRLDDRAPQSVEIACTDVIRAPPATTPISFEQIPAGTHRLVVEASPDGISATADLGLPALEVGEGGAILAGAFVRVVLHEAQRGRAGSATIEIAPPTALHVPGL